MTTVTFIEQIELMVSPEDSEHLTVCVEATGNVFGNSFGVPYSQFTDSEVDELNITLKSGEDITDRVARDDKVFQDLIYTAEEKLIEKYKQEGR